MNLLLSAVVLVVAMASATVSGLSLGAGPMKKVAVFGGTGVSDEFGSMTALFDVSYSNIICILFSYQFLSTLGQESVKDL